MLSSPRIASPSLGRLPAQALHVGTAGTDRVPLARLSAPQTAPLTEPQDPCVSWEALLRTFPQFFGKLMRKMGSFPVASHEVKVP